ncbi:MerR family transcriptional regulator [Spirilliplanes yamanashiensis]|uniref:MerR family transcriptional regulator n=1 Tax=Spirilliplanes yamanashiensis TaxID=42233 RepID=A0A8J4DFI4_9ACTN|nr:MerR family transcriptional regulator [Spirilliplanes yamanashiensis]MDP9814346.1 DNA-binding transcriptional MerR regulator [Spirilliplanes yamanashiensis]GIJ00672.1 MerR family transcriptional regulator [Spirilliplanes yamanashiensis]
MRLVELARRAGITEQQVRNYLADGLLPPAGRAANNYRVLTERHAAALTCLRALAAGHGWARARQIMTAVHAGDVAAALACVDDGHADLASERAAVAAASRAFAEVADAPAADARGGARIGRVARAVGVRTPVLRLWERRGLLRPERDPATGYRVFAPAEQRVAHLVAVLRAGGFDFGIIADAVGTLRERGSTADALAQLARRGAQVDEASRRRLAGTAALHGYLAVSPSSPPDARTPAGSPATRPASPASPTPA